MFLKIGYRKSINHTKYHKCIDFGIIFSVYLNKDEIEEHYYSFDPFYVHMHIGGLKKPFFRFRTIEIFKKQICPLFFRFPD